MRATGRRTESYSTVAAVKDSPSGGSKRFPSGGSERFSSTGRGAESHSTALSSPYMYLIFWSVRGKSPGVITQKHKQLSSILVNFILRIFLNFLQAAEARSTWLCCVCVFRPAFLRWNKLPGKSAKELRLAVYVLTLPSTYNTKIFHEVFSCRSLSRLPRRTHHVPIPMVREGREEREERFASPGRAQERLKPFHDETPGATCQSFVTKPLSASAKPRPRPEAQIYEPPRKLENCPKDLLRDL